MSSQVRAALIVGGSLIVAAALVVVVVLTREDGEGHAAAAVATYPQADSTVTAGTTEAPTESTWPPPLPPGVPTTGEHAWRATWTPDADAEQQYLNDIASGLDPAYFAARRDQLVDFGYDICASYYQGVAGADMYHHIIDVLVADPDFEPGLTNGSEYGDVRNGQAATAGIGIELAARGHFCQNIDPWGESY